MGPDHAGLQAKLHAADSKGEETRLAQEQRLLVLDQDPRLAEIQDPEASPQRQGVLEPSRHRDACVPASVLFHGLFPGGRFGLALEGAAKQARLALRGLWPAEEA
jgi:hypothetical protein